MAAGEDRDVVDRAAGQSFDLKINMDRDVTGSLDRGGSLERYAKILILNLRDRIRCETVEQVGGTRTVDADTTESCCGCSGREGIGGRSNWVACAHAEVGRLTIAYSHPDIVERARVA